MWTHEIHLKMLITDLKTPAAEYKSNKNLKSNE